MKVINPYIIPKYSDILKVSENKLDKEQFLWIVKIIKSFPKLHKFLVEISWVPRLPDFNLPTVLSANIVQYINYLAEKNEYQEIRDIFSYLEKVYMYWTRWEKDVTGDFILSYLYLLKHNLPGFEKLIPKNLNSVYENYFK